MPYTVWGAFNTFRETVVDLAVDDTKKARTSRDYLINQLKRIAGNDATFPPLSGGYIPYGSFARSTKICPLNDIDLLLLLNGSNTTASPSPNDPYVYWLRPSDSAPLSLFPDNCGYVSSIKILNKIKSSLSGVHSYSKAEVKRNQQAVVLNLVSYPWSFDIVPAVPFQDDWGNIACYLIPDGSGDWMRTDPRKDKAYVIRVSKQHGGLLLPTMRLLKYWNHRTHKPRLPPYYFETLVLKVFDCAPQIMSFPKAIEYFFNYCPLHLASSCPDPKGLGRALDVNIDSVTKWKVRETMATALTSARVALAEELESNPAQAIAEWKKVFGWEFPSYGG